MAGSETRIGISGWRYPAWRGTFYPRGLAQTRELWYASRQVETIEINGSFYSLQRPESFHRWYEDTPGDFVFSVKGPRFITHLKKLREIRVPLANFFASGVLRLAGKLGPILWQLPPGLALDVDRIAAFLDLLPRDTEQAAALAQRHDGRLAGRSWARTDRRRPLRYAVEIRHESFRDAAFIRLLRRHRVALVFADTAGRWPYAEDVTAEFVYARLHGDRELYVSGYGDAALDWWAARLATWRRGEEPGDARRVVDRPAVRRCSRDVFVYFDNDVKVRAPFDAVSLAARLGRTPGDRGALATAPDPRAVPEQPRIGGPGFRRASRPS